MAKIVEIFNSISGEVSPFSQGRLTTFVRLGECVGACTWCDTNYNNYTEMEKTRALNTIFLHMQKTMHVCVTGGEPLLQPEFVSYLIDRIPNIWIETSGLVPFENFIGKCGLVVDYKLDKQVKGNYTCQVTEDDYLDLKKTDFIKFIIGSKKDFMQFKILHKYLKCKNCKASMAISPVHGIVEPAQLVEWCFHENINDAILNVQMHKYFGLQ